VTIYIDPAKKKILKFFANKNNQKLFSYKTFVLLKRTGVGKQK